MAAAAGAAVWAGAKAGAEGAENADGAPCPKDGVEAGAKAEDGAGGKANPGADEAAAPGAAAGRASPNRGREAAGAGVCEGRGSENSGMEGDAEAGRASSAGAKEGGTKAGWALSGGAAGAPKGEAKAEAMAGDGPAAGAGAGAPGVGRGCSTGGVENAGSWDTEAGTPEDWPSSCALLRPASGDAGRAGPAPNPPAARAPVWLGGAAKGSKGLFTTPRDEVAGAAGAGVGEPKADTAAPPSGLNIPLGGDCWGCICCSGIEAGAAAGACGKENGVGAEEAAEEGAYAGGVPKADWMAGCDDAGAAGAPMPVPMKGEDAAGADAADALPEKSG